jgi:hypothetical protein
MMGLDRFVEGWVAPGLLGLAAWSIRWGVLIGALAAWFLMRPPRRAATRYHLALTALAAGLLLPIVPRWGAGVSLPRSGAPAVAVQRPDAAPPVHPAPAPPRTIPAVETARTVSAPRPIVEIPARPAPAVPPARPGPTAGSLALLAIAGAWLGGLAVGLARLAAGSARVERLRRGAVLVVDNNPNYFIFDDLPHFPRFEDHQATSLITPFSR